MWSILCCFELLLLVYLQLLRNRPDLQNVPVAVAHSSAASTKGFSEISSCNYPARAYGLKNGMIVSIHIVTTLLLFAFICGRHDADARA